MAYINPDQGEVLRAQQRVRRAVRRGQLVRGKCEMCGLREVVAHHDDYREPLKVRWLCRGHHNTWHSIHGPGKSHKQQRRSP